MKAIFQLLLSISTPNQTQTLEGAAPTEAAAKGKKTDFNSLLALFLLDGHDPVLPAEEARRPKQEAAFDSVAVLAVPPQGVGGDGRAGEAAADESAPTVSGASSLNRPLTAEMTRKGYSKHRATTVPESGSGLKEPRAPKEAMGNEQSREIAPGENAQPPPQTMLLGAQKLPPLAAVPTEYGEAVLHEVETPGQTLAGREKTVNPLPRWNGPLPDTAGEKVILPLPKVRFISKESQPVQEGPVPLKEGPPAQGLSPPTAVEGRQLQFFVPHPADQKPIVSLPQQVEKGEGPKKTVPAPEKTNDASDQRQDGPSPPHRRETTAVNTARESAGRSQPLSQISGQNVRGEKTKQKQPGEPRKVLAEEQVQPGQSPPNSPQLRSGPETERWAAKQVADSDAKAERVLNLQREQNLLPKLTQHIRTLVAAERSEVRIQLKPDQLGEMRIKLSLERGVMAAEFVVENETVRGIIQSNLPQLHTALQDQGAHVAEMTVNIGFGQEKKEHDSPRRDKQAAQNGRFAGGKPLQAEGIYRDGNPWYQVDLKA